MRDKKYKEKHAVKVIQQTRMSPIGYDFDVSALDASEYVGVLDTLFGSDIFDDLANKRHKLCRGLYVPGCNPDTIAKGIDQMDRKIADKIYEVMFVHCIGNTERKEGEPANILEFFKQFTGDEEKERKASRFWKVMRKVYILSDLLMGAVHDTDAILKSLDKNQRFIHVTTTLKATLDNLNKVTSGLARFKSDEENALFMKTCDSIEGYIDMRSEAFDKKIDKIVADRKKAEAREKKEKRAKFDKK